MGGFAGGPWQDGVDVRDFIQRNYTPYTGDAAFLAGATPRTTAIWERLSAMFPEERAKGRSPPAGSTSQTVWEIQRAPAWQHPETA